MKIIITGHSASGKDYLYKSLIDNYNLKPCVKYTTRPMRVDEINGVTYNYISDLEMELMKANDELLTIQEFDIISKNGVSNKWFYAFSKDSFKDSDIFIMTPYELRCIDKTFLNNCKVIYLNMDKSILLSRLLVREDSNDSVNRRLESDIEDFKGFDCYDIMITDPMFNVFDIYESIKLL